MNRLMACLYLNLLPHIGAVRALQLVRHCGSPEAVFTTDLKMLLAKKQLNASTYKSLKNWKSYTTRVYHLRDTIEKEEWDYWLWDTPEYPYYLKFCPDAPLVVFHKGCWQPQQLRVISIVGTRTPTRYGRESCSSLLEGLAPYEPTIVSGMAYGIDIHAQRKALDLGLTTLGCLAHDLNNMYPKKHLRFVSEILAQGGLLSEFLPNAPFERSNFIRRNRIIAGLAQATIVIETGNSGGSLLTANFAHSYHRELFALPGPIDAPKSSGCLNLIKQQLAQLLQEPEDVVRALQWEAPQTMSKSMKTTPPTEDPQEKQLWEFLSQQPKSTIDTLALATQIPVNKIASMLIVMEMKGVVRCLPGKVFELR